MSPVVENLREKKRVEKWNEWKCVGKTDRGRRKSMKVITAVGIRRHH